MVEYVLSLPGRMALFIGAHLIVFASLGAFVG